jgi:hypothetical protein
VRSHPGSRVEGEVDRIKSGDKKKGKGVPIPWHALPGANRPDGERIASPERFCTLFALKSGRRRLCRSPGTSAIPAGESGFALWGINTDSFEKL